ncbi:MAG: LytTR family transcriptional regulator DNA-binding domain-containing protein [Rikenellaceae bacterium]|nr:LytTR family transcriptional regulator DNA-binding domain-containing protein [Rikenellaceae bacterium]MCL2693003.1 LytTR family transcriptional regulator DNA-binding domain-containing protein [Rikenellaceae bacterium]
MTNFNIHKQLLSAVAAMGGLWVLLVAYGGLTVWPALADSMIYAALLFGAGRLYRYAAGNTGGFLSEAVIAVVVQLLCVGLTFAVMTGVGMLAVARFIHVIPLQAIYGLLLWIALAYRSRIAGIKARITAEESLLRHATPPDAAKIEVIDRISVKNGAQIEIISITQLTYIQAYGDYVMLYTDTGRHIKEQTMKFYETALPDSFVRVHRSFIVNTDRIARIELAGKDNYTLKLKNGAAIRVSPAGYKLLRQRLSL